MASKRRENINLVSFICLSFLEKEILNFECYIPVLMFLLW